MCAEIECVCVCVSVWNVCVRNACGLHVDWVRSAVAQSVSCCDGLWLCVFNDFASSLRFGFSVFCFMLFYCILFSSLLSTAFRVSVSVTLYIQFWLGKDVLFCCCRCVDHVCDQLTMLAMRTRWRRRRRLLQSHLAGHAVHARVLRQLIHGGFYKPKRDRERESGKKGKWLV